MVNDGSVGAKSKCQELKKPSTTDVKNVTQNNRVKDS
jgi:hypothetical protein